MYKSQFEKHTGRNSGKSDHCIHSSHSYMYLIAPIACMKVLVLVREEGTPEAEDFSLVSEVRR